MSSETIPENNLEMLGEGRELVIEKMKKKELAQAMVISRLSMSRVKWCIANQHRNT